MSACVCAQAVGSVKCILAHSFLPWPLCLSPMPLTHLGNVRCSFDGIGCFETKRSESGKHRFISSIGQECLCKDPTPRQCNETVTNARLRSHTPLSCVNAKPERPTICNRAEAPTDLLAFDDATLRIEAVSHLDSDLTGGSWKKCKRRRISWPCSEQSWLINSSSFFTPRWRLRKREVSSSRCYPRRFPSQVQHRTHPQTVY